jgi:putative metallohydrolase (TIGR04338 family)
VYVTRICESKFWKKLGGSPLVHIKDGRGTRRAMAHSHNTISMPMWSRHEAVTLHELTHTLVNFRGKEIAWHGPEFCKTFLVVVRHYMGKEEYLKLRASFKEHRVRYSIRRK